MNQRDIRKNTSGSRNNLGEGLVLERTEEKQCGWSRKRQMEGSTKRERWTRAKPYRTFRPEGEV